MILMDAFSSGSLSMLAAMPLNLSSLATISTDESPLASSTLLRVWKTIFHFYQNNITHDGIPLCMLCWSVSRSKSENDRVCTKVFIACGSYEVFRVLQKENIVLFEWVSYSYQSNGFESHSPTLIGVYWPAVCIMLIQCSLQHSQCQGCTAVWLPGSTWQHTQQWWMGRCRDSHFHCQPITTA